VKRLRDELPEGFARELLDSARHDAPSARAAKRGLAVAVAALSSKTAAGAFLTGKVGLAVLAAAATVGGVATLRAVTASKPAGAPALGLVVAAPPPRAAGSELETVRVEAAPAPERKVAAPVRQPIASPASVPDTSSAGESWRGVTASPSPAAAVQSPSSDDLRAQVQLIERARTLVEQGDAAALALLDSYARQWPQGPFVIEADILAIEAERRSGAVEQARARAKRFLAEYHSAAYEARVRRALDGASIP
jgi:hypothetical protein